MGGLVEFLLFCASTGVLFSKYHQNKFAVIVAGSIAIASTVSLFYPVFENVVKRWSISATPQPVSSPAIEQGAIKPATVSPPNIDPVAVELAFWQSVDKSDAAQLKVYLERYPRGQFSGIAQSRLTQLLSPPAAHTVQPDPVAASAPSSEEGKTEAKATEHRPLCVEFNRRTICDSD